HGARRSTRQHRYTRLAAGPVRPREVRADGARRYPGRPARVRRDPGTGKGEATGRTDVRAHPARRGQGPWPRHQPVTHPAAPPSGATQYVRALGGFRPPGSCTTREPSWVSEGRRLEEGGEPGQTLDPFRREQGQLAAELLAVEDDLRGLLE